MTNTLIIDDDADFSEVIAQMLVKEGCEVEVVNSMPEAKAWIGRFGEFDLILLDIWLHGNSSLGLIDEITEEAPNIAIAMMSGGGGPLPLDVATSIGNMKGVNNLLQKPIRRERLRQLLGQLQVQN